MEYFADLKSVEQRIKGSVDDKDTNLTCFLLTLFITNASNTLATPCWLTSAHRAHGVPTRCGWPLQEG